MMFYLIQSLQMIASVYLNEIRRARQEHPEHSDEIEHQLGWYLAFFSYAAHSAAVMNFTWIENATKCLGWIGLASIDEDFFDTTRSVAGKITSIAKATVEKIPKTGSHQLARLLFPLRLMAELATQIGATCLVEEIRTIEEKILSELARYGDLKTMLDRQEQHWHEEVLRNTRGWLLDPNDPEALLLKILQRRAREPANKSADSSAESSQT